MLVNAEQSPEADCRLRTGGGEARSFQNSLDDSFWQHVGEPGKENNGY